MPVVGAGVSGLTTSVLLREAGIDAVIIAREPPAATTSDMAAAIWYPTVAAPVDRVLEWSARSLGRFFDLAGEQETGVYLTEIREFTALGKEDPAWSDLVPGFRHLEEEELPAGKHAGLAVQVPRIEPPTYLRYLLDRFRALGGRLQRADVADIESLVAMHPVVINCTGLGSGALVDDPEVFPIRGQVVMVENPGIPRGLIDETDPDRMAYVLPRTHQTVLGGTREIGSWDTTPDEGTTRRILADCALLEPRLAEPTIIGVRVGLRPGRTSVRVEVEELDEGVVVHNYGHGGSGFTLSWGCAADASDLVVQAIA